MSDSLDMTGIGSADELKGYDYPKAGQYHCSIASFDDSREKVDALRFEIGILAGTVEGQDGKTWKETFWDPNPSHRDGGKFAVKRLASFALATGLITKEQLGSNVEIDWSQIVGRQLVCTIVEYTRDGDEGKVYKGAEVGGLKFFSIDDPEVAMVPKDAKAAALLGGEVPGARPTSGNGTPAPAPAPAPVPPKKGGSDWSQF